MMAPSMIKFDGAKYFKDKSPWMIYFLMKSNHIGYVYGRNKIRGISITKHNYASSLEN